MIAGRKPILMLGAHPERVKGGVSTCARNILSSDLVKDYPITYIATKVDGSNLVKLGVAIQAVFLFLWKLGTINVALIHIHGSHYASFYRKMIFILLAKMAGKKVLFHCHGSRFDQFYLKGPSWQKRLIRKILSLCDRVVVLSPFWKTFFEEFLDVNLLSILPNAIILSNYQSPGNKEKKLGGKPIVLFAGEVGERKGVYDLLAVIPRLVLKFPQVTVRFAGNGDLEKIRHTVKSLKIEEHVELTDWVTSETLIDYYYESVLFVLPSYHEGLPMAILEAMACGLAVVSTRVGGIPELIREGENGFLIDPGDQGGLEEALSALLADPSRREQMGRNNIEKIRDEYEMSVYSARLRDLYRELLGEQ
jgi:glycosyltransferase involved in cell wall biosynthesis